MLKYNQRMVFRMKKLSFLFILFLLCSCSKSNNINYMEAKEKIINNNAVLVDVRDNSEFLNNHIDNAYNLSLSLINSESLSEIIDSENRYIIVYCSSDDDNRCENAIEKITGCGYKNVFNLGGINNWKE